MENIKELLMKKSSEIENIKAPDCMEEMLREALDKKSSKSFNAWKVTAVAASMALVIGLSSLSFMNSNKQSIPNTNRQSSSAIGNNKSKSPVSEEKALLNPSVGFDIVTTGRDDIGAMQDKASVTSGNTHYNSSSNTPSEPQYSENNSAKKVIKNAEVTMEAQKAEDTFDKIAKWVASNGGYEFSRNISVNGANKQVEAVFKVNPDKLYAMLDFLKSVGKVTNSQATSSDITDEYFDSAARLKSLKAGRTQMMEVMKQAFSIEEILLVQNELNTITAEIESLQDTINRWDKQLAESSVTLTIHEEGSPLLAVEKVDWKFKSTGQVFISMKNGFIKSINNLFNAIIWVLVFLATSAPIILVAGIAAFFIWRYIRRRKKEDMK